MGPSSHLFQRVASFLLSGSRVTVKWTKERSHLFQRVASFLPNKCKFDEVRSLFVLISFREWLHSYLDIRLSISHIRYNQFSSLSESGFIPTEKSSSQDSQIVQVVLISFREWLHSYADRSESSKTWNILCSHLFQRVASFLLQKKIYWVPR